MANEIALQKYEEMSVTALKKELSRIKKLEKQITKILAKKDISQAVPYKEIIDYLNQTCHTAYRHTTAKYKTLINARWKEGWRLEDFRYVISVKALEWLDDTQMFKYLNPETLFGTKFEKYRNQKVDNNDILEKTVEMSEGWVWFGAVKYIWRNVWHIQIW